jgi:glycosyltransferase involved in cell wall biosynthesis
MEDFPAGADDADLRRPRFSVVIPVFNGEDDLERCLRRLRLTEDVDFELIVVDDGSTDSSSRVAEFFGARVIHHDHSQGPAAARNTGAVAAQGEIIFFLDADVAVHPQTLPRALARFQTDGTLVALFGSYDNRPEAKGVVSQYRNLLHHFVHQNGHFENDIRPVHTFWTGCGAIRREAFLDAGGFDPQLYRRPAIEDIELGYRVTRAGGKIVLARDVLATHLKRWTLRNVIRTDIFQRGVPWMLLMKRCKVAETDLNVGLSGRLSVAATGLFGLSTIAAMFMPELGMISLTCLLTIILLNHKFYDFLARTKGKAFTAACFPLHMIYFVCCAASVVIALSAWHLWLSRVDGGGAISKGMRLDEASATQAIPKPTVTRTRRFTRWPK